MYEWPFSIKNWVTPSFSSTQKLGGSVYNCKLTHCICHILQKISASPQQQTNEWCRISQLLTWISTIKRVEKYETANWSLRQGEHIISSRKK